MVKLNDILKILGSPESETLEYKAVLPPSRSLAQLIASFANSKGGNIILGVQEKHGNIDICGLSTDFHVDTIVSKAIDLLSPTPKVTHHYIEYRSKSLYVIEVKQNEIPVAVEGKIFVRAGEATVLQTPEKIEFKETVFPRIQEFSKNLEGYIHSSSEALSNFVSHYQSILKLIDDLSYLLFPEKPEKATSNQEGKILTRIFFSSCADNFESYLSDLLYEIYLAKPETLRSEEKVSIKDVLNCRDLDEFISFWAKRKISKLQRGSVKGFISDNIQLKSLNVIDDDQVREIEKILQIRHLYAHKNGIVDEKFLQYYPESFKLNEEHQLPITSILEKFEFLISVAVLVD